MKKNSPIKLFVALLGFLALLSFSNSNPETVFGTYSVYDSDPAQIKLIVNSDNTFYYQDFSNTYNKIEVTGTWTQKGDKILLNENNFTGKFHNVWTIDANGKVAKSHKGLTFYRLVKLD